MAFPISDASPVAHQGPLPQSADVVVLGGGVVGVMTAWALADRGFRVTLCEKGRIAGEQSSRNWGWVRQQGRDFAELPIMMESLALWQDLQRTLGDGIGLRQEGTLYIARTEAEMAGFAAWANTARSYGLDSRILGRAELAALIPGHVAPWLGALYTSSDARAEPWTAVPLIARALAAKGVTLRENCAVRALDLSAGRIAGVVTEAGRIACDQVVVAGGVWSSLFLRAHGVNIPQLAVKATAARTLPMAETFAGGAADDRFAFRRRLDGGYTIARSGAHDFALGPDAFRHFGVFQPVMRKSIKTTRFFPAAPKDTPDAWGTPRHWAADEVSPFERMRILNPAPNLKRLAQVCDDFAKALPHLGRPVIADAWAGMIDTTPDAVPFVDRVPSVPGLVIATGTCGHGFGIGPGLGRVIADLVADRPTGHDLSRFRFSRFTDGSKIDLAPSL